MRRVPVRRLARRSAVQVRERAAARLRSAPASFQEISCPWRFLQTLGGSSRRSAMYVVKAISARWPNCDPEVTSRSSSKTISSCLRRELTPRGNAAADSADRRAGSRAASPGRSDQQVHRRDKACRARGAADLPAVFSVRDCCRLSGLRSQKSPTSTHRSRRSIMPVRGTWFPLSADAQSFSGSRRAWASRR